MEFEQVFMFYLPRICEHCLNPSCVASCPSGAMYKREEDGIVLVDQDRCRGWRFCVSGCPYKKVYFNHRTGKAEKCTFCFPRIEAGQPTICSETCVGRLRYLGLILYDADKVLGAAATPGEQDLYQAQLDVFLDPHDPRGAGRGGRSGHPARLDRGRAALAGVRAGRAAPGRAAAAPGVPHPADGLVHPAAVAGRRRRPRAGYDPADPTASSPPSTRCASRWSTWPTCSRPGTPRPSGRCCASSPPCAPSSGPASSAWTWTRTCPPRSGPRRTISTTCTGCSRSPSTSDRYVIPPAHAEEAGRLMGQHEQLFCSLDTEGGPGMGGAGPHGIQAWRPPGAPGQDHTFRADDGRTRFNLLGWDGQGDAPHLFPERGGS